MLYTFVLINFNTLLNKVEISFIKIQAVIKIIHNFIYKINNLLRD